MLKGKIRIRREQDCSDYDAHPKDQPEPYGPREPAIALAQLATIRLCNIMVSLLLTGISTQVNDDT
jgi:hypothetical protein